MNLSAFLGAVLFAILLAGFWIYKTHPEAFQDAIADISNDPKGVRAQWTKAKSHQAESSADKKENSPTATSSETPAPTPVTTEVPAVASTPSTSDTPDAALTFVPPNPLPAQPNWIWTASDGKVYNNVIVQLVDADCVTILDSDGGARVDIALLPADIQKQLNYNPALAKEAAEKRAVELASSKEATIAEKQAIQENQKKMSISQSQALANMHEAELDAERKGRIENLSADIIELQAVIDGNSRSHVYDSSIMTTTIAQSESDRLRQDRNDADRERLRIMKLNLEGLKKEEAAATAAAATSAASK